LGPRGHPQLEGYQGGGEVHWGTPARPLKEYLETLANLSRLPELRRRVAELEKLVRQIEPQDLTDADHRWRRVT